MLNGSELKLFLQQYVDQTLQMAVLTIYGRVISSLG